MYQHKYRILYSNNNKLLHHKYNNNNQWCKIKWCNNQWCKTKWCNNQWCKTKCRTRCKINLIHTCYNNNNNYNNKSRMFKLNQLQEYKPWTLLTLWLNQIITKCNKCKCNNNYNNNNNNNNNSNNKLELLLHYKSILLNSIRHQRPYKSSNKQTLINT